MTIYDFIGDTGETAESYWYRKAMGPLPNPFIGEPRSDSMSDHYTTQRNHKRRCMEDLRAVMQYTELGHYSHRKHLALLKERLWESDSYKRLTRYNKSYISGQYDALLAKMEFDKMDWRVYHPELGHVRRENYDMLDGRWSECVSGMGASFWKDTDDKVWSATPAVFEMYGLDPSDGYE